MDVWHACGLLAVLISKLAECIVGKDESGQQMEVWHACCWGSSTCNEICRCMGD